VQEALEGRQAWPLIDLVLQQIACQDQQIGRVRLEPLDQPVVGPLPARKQVDIGQLDDPETIELRCKPRHGQVIPVPLKARGCEKLYPWPPTAQPLRVQACAIFEDGTSSL